MSSYCKLVFAVVYYPEAGGDPGIEEEKRVGRKGIALQTDHCSDDALLIRSIINMKMENNH